MNNIPFMNLKDCYEDIYDEIMEKIKSLINNTQFIGGEEVALFEKEYAEYSRCKYAVGCSNGTDAIEVGLKTLNIGKGDAVLVPANSFIATAEAVTNVGAEVIFIDVEDDYYTINPVKVREYLLNSDKKNIKGIISVHLYGQMANMPEIMEIAKEYKLKVLEDSAQAHGSELNGKRPGEYGDIATFSFYPGKNLGAFGDAGALVTNNKDLYEKSKMIINHGRNAGEKYSHEIVGGNKRIDTLQAAILRIKLRYIEEWTEIRKEKVQYYLDTLSSKESITLPKIRKNSSPVWHLLVIRNKNRDTLQRQLKEKGISTGIHYPIPLHLQPAYKFLGYKYGEFKITEKHAKEILSLPLWPEIKEEQIDFICSQI